MTITNIDDYIGSFPAHVQDVLTEIRRTIQAVAPVAEETISYNMPTFELDGKYLVYFAGWKNHVSVYPVPTVDEDLERQIAPYRSGQGTLKFPLAKPVPYGVIEQVVRRLVDQRQRGN